jgi:hypothetical protein
VHRTVVFALLAGCRLNFFELDDSVDAPPSELGPWSEPTRVVELSSSDSDDDPSLTADQLEIYFDSGRFTTGGAGGDVWVATRTSTSEPFGPPVVIDPFVSGFDDTTGDLSPDGLRIYVASNRVSTADRDVFVSSRANRQSPWSPLSIISELTSPAQDSGVCESADGLTLLFASERTGSGDFYIVTRATPTSPWSVPELVAGINTNGEESQQGAKPYRSGRNRTGVSVAREELLWNRFPTIRRLSGVRPKAGHVVRAADRLPANPANRK